MAMVGGWGLFALLLGPTTKGLEKGTKEFLSTIGSKSKIKAIKSVTKKTPAKDKQYPHLKKPQQNPNNTNPSKKHSLLTTSIANIH